MGMLGYLLLFVFVFPFINRLMYINPILGILSYALMIWSMVSVNKRRRQAFQSAYANQQNNTYSSSQNTQDTTKNTTQQRPIDKDVIDVEYTQEDI